MASVTHHDSLGDHQLLDRIVARDAGAIATLYDRHGRLLLKLIFRVLQDRGEAEEILQEVFLVAWARVGTYDARLGSPVAWLVRIARNRAIDRLRANRTRSRVAGDVPVAEPMASPEATALLTERRRVVTDALRTLPANQRELIKAAYFEGLSQSELAAHFRLPLGTVKTRIRDGLKALRDTLQHLHHVEGVRRRSQA
jgi:RNA polymerase sigma-70 factor (ECF subfamily)